MMPDLFDITKMLAGVAFFLLAMDMMESTLHQLVGRRFKLFLKKQTHNKWKAIGGAAIVTGFLQSSSIVNLLVLSMVGAGVVQMENALALILGANVGTTLDSWIVASIGFDLNIERLIYPIVGISGIWMMFARKENRFALLLKFIFSFGFLFVALDFIKSGMETWVKQTDLSVFNHYPAIVFLLVGIFITTIIQSSSATIALTLSALHVNMISLYAAMAIVLGSEIGTTFKLFLAAVKGIALKKRVALGNFIFNLITVVVVFPFLQPINQLIVNTLHVHNNLIALVFFQTIINLICLIIFFPFLNWMGKLLLKYFVENDKGLSVFDKVKQMDTDQAIITLDGMTQKFINFVIRYSLASLDVAFADFDLNTDDKEYDTKTITEKYDYIKTVYAKMHGSLLQLQQVAMLKTSMIPDRIEQLLNAMRNSMYAAKSIKNAQNDIHQMRSSSNEVKYNFYLQAQTKLLDTYRQVLVLIHRENPNHNHTALIEMYQSISAEYPKLLQGVYENGRQKHVNEIETTTLINLSRELYGSIRYIFLGLKSYMLTNEEEERFDSLDEFVV